MWYAPLFFAHITLNPDLGALSGGYFHTTLRVPHGAPGLHTTRLEIEVPHGVLVVKPEVPGGWTATTHARTLGDDEAYLSHGVLKTSAPHRVVLESETHADGVHDDHLLNIDLQTKLGCTFRDTASSSVWNGAYTLWWRVTQVCEDVNGTLTVLAWNGTQPEGSTALWTDLPSGDRPSPYMFVEPGTRCHLEHSAQSGGMSWHGSYVSPDDTTTPEDTTTPDDTTNSGLVYMSLVTSVVSLLLGATTFVAWSVVLAVRIRNQRRFTEQLLGIEYIPTSKPLGHPTGAAEFSGAA